jgi:hypothetical protein
MEFRSKEEWRAFCEQKRAEIATTLAEHGPLFQQLQGRVEPFWEHAVIGKVYERRRPPLGLRIPALGEPAARVAIYPHWLNNHGLMELVRGKVHVEFLIMRLRFSGKLAPDKRLGFALGNGEPRIDRYYPGTITDDLGRMVEAITDFVKDPLAAFRRSSGHCCICGKPLTDGMSRSRGIGPECLQKTSFFRGAAEHWDAELEAQSVAMVPEGAEPEEIEAVPQLTR